MPSKSGRFGTGTGTCRTPDESTTRKPQVVTVRLSRYCTQPLPSCTRPGSGDANRKIPASGLVVIVSPNDGLGITGRPLAAITGDGLPQPGPMSPTPADPPGTWVATVTVNAPGPGSAWSRVTAPATGAVAQSNQKLNT